MIDTKGLILFHFNDIKCNFNSFKKIDFKIKYLPYLGLLSYTWYLTHNSIGIIIIRELNNLNYQNVSVFIAIISTLFFSFFNFQFY